MLYSSTSKSIASAPSAGDPGAMTVTMTGNRMVTLPGELVDALELVPRGRNFPEPEFIDYPRHLARPGAVCASTDPDGFFGETDVLGSKIPSESRVACAGCPQQRGCMKHAIENEGHGLWALMPIERYAFGGVRAPGKHVKLLEPWDAAARAVSAGIDPYVLADVLTDIYAGNAASLRAVPAEDETVTGRDYSGLDEALLADYPELQETLAGAA